MRPFANVLMGVLLTACGAHRDDPTAAASAISPQDARGLAQPSNQVQPEIEVWVDLSEPSMSTASSADEEARAALRDRIDKQQDEVMSQLGALGAKELARVTGVRNSIAVRIPSGQLEHARNLQGVVKVRLVKHRRRMP